MGQERRLEFGSAHWLDLTNANREELRTLCERLRLPKHVAEDCLDPSHLPKFQRLPEGSFLLLRSFDEKSEGDTTSAQKTTRKLAMLWGEGYLVTVHRAELPWVDEVWRTWSTKADRPAEKLAALLYDLVENCLFTYEDPIDRAAEAVSQLEDKIFAERSTRAARGAMLETAYLVKKRSTTFKRLLRLTRDLLPNVSKLGDPTSPAVQSLKEEADRLYFYADDLVESASDLVQLSISMSANRMNEIVRVLTIVSIFLLPLNLVTGIYGMNFDFMPETKWRLGYPTVLASMLVVEVAIYWLLKKKGWIRSGNRGAGG